jgi:hypothetical protein
MDIHRLDWIGSRYFTLKEKEWKYLSEDQFVVCTHFNLISFS